MDRNMAGGNSGTVGRGQRTGRGGTGHLSVAEAVSYVDRTLSRRVRTQVEDHLLYCEACFQEVVDVTLFLQGLNQPEDGLPWRADAPVAEGKG